MKNKEEDNRRSFLKQVLVGSVAVVGAATAVKSARAKDAATLDSSDETLYHESESFKKYYETLRS